MADKILYANKEKLLDDITIPNKNKVTADDMNEIKEVANAHADDIDELDEVKANRTEIPTDLSQLSNETTKFVNETQLSEAIESEELAREEADENIQGQIDSINDDISALDDRVEANEDDIADINLEQTVQDNEIGALKLDSGHTIELSLNTTNYELSAKLKNKTGTVLNTSTIDLPLETMIINVEYDNANKQLIITLQNGNKIYVPIADIIGGLQSEITPENMLSSDLVDDNNHAHKFISISEKTKLEGIETGAEVNVIEVIKVDGTAITVTDKTVNIDLSAKEDKSNKVTSISSSSTDTQYPSAKCVYDSQVEQNNEISVLRNLAETELEDTTATGTSITVNDSANAPAKLLPSGNTYQAQYEGKNILDGANPTNLSPSTNNIAINNNIIIVSSVTTTTIPYSTWEYDVAENDVIRINGIIKNSNGRIRIQSYDGTNWTSRVSSTYVDGSTISSLEYIVPSGVSKVRVFLYANDGVPTGDASSSYENVIVTKNNENMSYEPYVGGQTSPSPDYPQTIHNLSGHNEFKVQNKNLAPTDWASKFVTAVNNNNQARLETKDNRNCLFFTPASGYGNYDTKNLSLGMKFKEKTQYTISCDLFKESSASSTIAIYYTDGTYTSIGSLTSANVWEHKSTVSTANKTIAYIAPFYTSGNTYIDIDTWQIEEGINETSYVEHEEQTAEFTLVEGQKMFLGDYLADDGIHHKYAKVILDGSEPNWGKNYATVQTNAYTCSSVFINRMARGNTMCNYLKKISSTSGTGIFGGLAINFCFESSDFDTVEKLKAWISTNNLEVVYELAEEVIEPYTELQQAQYNRLKKMLSYFGQTNVNTITAGDLEAILNLDYKKSNRLRIDALENAIISLGGNI